MENTAQAPQDRTQELVGQTIKSIYNSTGQIRIHLENGLDIMITPKVTVRDFDGVTPILNFEFVKSLL